jgi:hypothetical protein
MDILSLIVGLFMIGLGFLVKSVPDLIAGYSTMPEDKKKNVDIQGLSTYMRNGLITIGLCIITGYFVFKWIGFIMVASSMILLMTTVGLTIMVINAQKYDKNKKQKTRLTYFIPVIAAFFVTGLIIYGFIPSKVSYTDDSVRLSGMYGFEIKINDIKKAELIDTIPTIKIRTNGFSFGSVKKGFFFDEKSQRIRLLIHSDKSPYLILLKKNGDKIILNFKNRIDTEETYNKITARTDK